jgi:hypothetical protein
MKTDEFKKHDLSVANENTVFCKHPADSLIDIGDDDHYCTACTKCEKILGGIHAK